MIALILVGFTYFTSGEFYKIPRTTEETVVTGTETINVKACDRYNCLRRIKVTVIEQGFGDVNWDGITDIYDIAKMASCYQEDASCCPDCDSINDGKINIFDMVIASSNYRRRAHVYYTPFQADVKEGLLKLKGESSSSKKVKWLEIEPDITYNVDFHLCFELFDIYYIYGIFDGECSPSTKPKYCYDLGLIDKCSQCGCPENQICNLISEECYELPDDAEDAEKLSWLAWRSFKKTYDSTVLSNTWKRGENTDIWATEWSPEIASFIIAYKKGYITKEEAINNIRIILDRLKSIERWHGLWFFGYSALNWERTSPRIYLDDANNRLYFSLIFLRQAMPEEFGDEVTELIEEMNDGYRYLYENYATSRGLGPQGIENIDDMPNSVWYTWSGTYGEVIASASIYSHVMSTSQPLVDLQVSDDCEYEGIVTKNYKVCDDETCENWHYFCQWNPWSQWVMIFFVPDNNWRWNNEYDASQAYIKYHELEIAEGGPLGMADGDTEWDWVKAGAPWTGDNYGPWENMVFPLGTAMANVFHPNHQKVKDSLRFWIENEGYHAFCSGDCLRGAYNAETQLFSVGTWNYVYSPTMTFVALNHDIVREHTFNDPIVQGMYLRFLFLSSIR